jgi:PEP-CTERM motif
MIMSLSLDNHLWSVAGVFALALAGASETQGGIVLNGGTLNRNGDPLYAYVATASLTDGTTFQQNDSFSILGMIGVGELFGMYPPFHFEPSDNGSLPTYAFSFNLDPDQPLPPPFPQDVTYPTSDVTWTNSSGPTVQPGSTLGQFGVETSVELPELYPTISSITLPWTATLDGGTEQDSGTVTFYLASIPEPSSLTIAGIGMLGILGRGLIRRCRRA